MSRSNEQILKAVIEKAEKNGWKTTFKSFTYQDEIQVEETIFQLLIGNVYFITIFSRSFAKAYFGEELYYEEGDIFKTKKWEIYIQRLALAEDRLRYLEKFL